MIEDPSDGYNRSKAVVRVVMQCAAVDLTCHYCSGIVDDDLTLSLSGDRILTFQ